MQVPEQIGRYQIIGMIGKGGMGFVLKGYDATLQRQVAIKVLYPHLAQDENTVARFLTEARTAASLQHPNIIAIYEAGEDRGLYYFAMEFVDGKDLGTIIRERGRLRLEEALPILEQIGMALDYAHQRGIIHRDIKASNIMVTVEGLVKVTDFGIARVLGGERFTQTGVLVGTPEYMAPELWEGHEASKASDIYALGVLTYEMLTGEVPFTGTTPMAIGYKHVHEEVPVDKLRGIISDDALEALKISLAKSPERRFQSAVAFVRALKRQAFDLTQATKSTPVATPEPSVSTASVSSTTPVSLTTPPTTVAVKRPRWLVWVAGFLFVLGLVVIILGGQVKRLLSERRLEQEIYRALEEKRLISPPNDNALELYRRLRREFPNSATFQRVQAKVLNVLRDEINRGFDNFYRTSREDSQMWQELKKLCDWAVDIAPYDNWLKARQRYCYGRLEFLSKRYDNAILAYKEAIQNDPNWALPYESIKNIQIQQQISQINLEKKLLENIIYRWKEAWENKDIEKYMSFYSLNFQGVIYSGVRKLLNYYEWMDYKKRLFDKYNFIKINIKNLNIVISKDYAKVSFYQEFRSDKYSDKGRKILMLRKENNKWKIIKEDFIKYSD